MEQKNWVSAPAPRTHLSHPHGVRVFMLIEEMMAGIAKAAQSRGMVFHVTPQAEQTIPGRYRDSWLVWREHTPQGTIQIPLLECVVERTEEHPERKAVRSPMHLHSVPTAQRLINPFSKKHANHMYGGCGLLFSQLDELIRKIVSITDCYCMVQVSSLPAQCTADAALRDMLVFNFVLKDELFDERGMVLPYDYQITFIWNGPLRFRRLLEQAYGINP